MHVAQQNQFTFFLTGRLVPGLLEPIEGRGLLPAALAPYRDLIALRYDFPLVLTPGAPPRSLSALFDAAVADAGESEAAARLRCHAKLMETALRRLVAEGPATSLAAAWEIAAGRLADAPAETGPDLRDSLDRLRPCLPPDGALAGCDRQLATRLIAHEWNEQQGAKTEKLRATIGALVARLEDILKADYAASAAGRSPERLRAAIGAGLAASFDFDAMSRLLGRAAPADGLDEPRRRRIEWLLTVLRTQRFAPLPGHAASPYGFVFDSCGTALQAWRERLPAAAELERVIAIARLEAAGDYNETIHDALFASLEPSSLDTSSFDAGGCDAAPAAFSPGYLVCVADRDLTPERAAVIVEALGAGLPFKVLVQTDDLLGNDGNMAALGLRVRPVVATALGLGDVFVLQAGASQLFGQLARVRAGLDHAGPALFSIYSGAGPATASLPPYLVSAAAVESRAFPAFVYDPGAGSDRASRFSLDANPQPERDWPLHPVCWEDAAHRRQGEMLAFTLIDFLALDRRAAPHLARIPASSWNGHLLAVAEAVAQPKPEGRVPSLLMTDAEGGLHKVLADDSLLREARRCLGRWRALQELSGTTSAHLAPPLGESQAAPAAPPAALPAEPTPEPAPEPAPLPGAPYIETARCSSCNECIRVNDRMFGYDANRQATLLDPAAGSFRQLVEAAESCQVSVIHPGQPRNPDEPGLEELLERAAPFQ